MNCASLLPLIVVSDTLHYRYVLHCDCIVITVVSDVFSPYSLVLSITVIHAYHVTEASSL